MADTVWKDTYGPYPIRKTRENVYEIKGKTNNYWIFRLGTYSACTCPDFIFRNDNYYKSIY